MTVWPKRAGVSNRLLNRIDSWAEGAGLSDQLLRDSGFPVPGSPLNTIRLIVLRLMN